MPKFHTLDEVELDLDEVLRLQEWARHTFSRTGEPTYWIVRLSLLKAVNMTSTQVLVLVAAEMGWLAARNELMP